MKNSTPYIIAEAGVNHNGDINLAKNLIDIAYDSGADAVKFQTWKPGELTGQFAFKVDYLDKHTPKSETRFELSKRLCLSYDAFRELKLYCEKVGIQFLSTPDGFESLDFLVDELDMPIIKIGSTELNHILFLEAVGKKDRPVILSTGLGTLDEVSLAIKALQRGGGKDLPITILQCTSEYPAPPDEMNIYVIKTFLSSFNLPVGLSDHSSGMEAAIASVALGASVIEKHFTIDKEMDGPDHSASLNPDELKEFVKVICRVKIMLGDGNKHPTKSERKNMEGIRRSVVANRNLKAGLTLEMNDLICKRPGTGVSPSEIMLLVGRVLKRDLIRDEPINWEDLVS
jgi:N-acetylneuraminate synthase/N,N'-diacetyllegionaminate synthase